MVEVGYCYVVNGEYLSGLYKETFEYEKDAEEYARTMKDGKVGVRYCPTAVGRSRMDRNGY